MEFKGMNLLSADQFDIPGLERLYRLAERMSPISRREVRCQVLGGYILGSFFFEDSTRTRLGSNKAFLRLGGSIQPLVQSKEEGRENNGELLMSGTSMSKGESFPDTMTVLGKTCDMMIIRHPKIGQVHEAARYAGVPVINGGDGVREHPTQGLLDWFTIRRRKGTLDGLTVALIGDLDNGRTVHSLSKILSLYQGVRFIFIAPPSIQMPQEIIQELRGKGFQVDLTDDLSAIAEADVNYLTRIQRERFKGREDQYEAVKGVYVLTHSLAEKWCKPDSLILHPGPIIDEIERTVYTMPQFAVFEQVENGVLTKMAWFLLVLGKDYKLV